MRRFTQRPPTTHHNHKIQGVYTAIRYFLSFFAYNFTLFFFFLKKWLLEDRLEAVAAAELEVAEVHPVVAAAAADEVRDSRFTPMDFIRSRLIW